MTYENLDRVRDDMRDLNERLDETGRGIGECQEKLKAIESIIAELSEETKEGVEERRDEVEATMGEQKDNAAEIVVELGKLEAEVEDLSEANERDRQALSSLAGAGIDVGPLQGECDYRRTRVAAYKDWIGELSSKASHLAGLRGGEPPENLPVL